MHTHRFDQLSSQVTMQSLIFTHHIPMQWQRTMQELLHGYEGVAGVITAFVALVSLQNHPSATQGDVLNGGER